MRALLALTLAALALPGCGFLFTTIADATRGPPAPFTVGALVSGQTGGGGTHRAISCGAASGSPQREHAFVAPTAGIYTFGSSTTDYDGVLAIYDSAGNELGCNDDYQGTRSSQVTVTLTEGQSVIAVQGGYAGGSGSYQLSVTATSVSSTTGSMTLADGTVVPVTPSAPPQDLATNSTVMGDTSGLTGIADVGCPPMGPMQEWRFTAPADGSFLFQVDSTYDAYLGVIDALGTAMACNDDFESTAHARVTVDLARGDVVRVIVGGLSYQSGSYSLTALTIGSGGPITLGQPMLFSPGTTDSEPNVCGAPAGSVDRTFTFTPRAEAFYAFTADVTGLLVIGDGRRTAACIPLSPDRRAGFVLKAGHRYSLVLELGYADGFAHTFSVDRVDPAAPDWQVPPQTIPIVAFTTPAAAP